MMKRIGRIIARREVAGLFIPMEDKTLHGIYEIREVMGTLTIHRIGEPALDETRLQALDLEGLFCERDAAGLTQDEWDQVT